MNWDIIEGKWGQLKGTIKNQWAKLTDDDVAAVSAKKENLIGRLQERYGLVRDEAEKQVDAWIARVGDPKDAFSSPDTSYKGSERKPKGAEHR